ncbi:hypothetical protein F383_19195 [Gossypium arboreum]|uniref:Uncharacterized protein n=1 Tax=Gossypium arboreum TaxID=29729 RepID=A0A0B0NS28_GOSAR|nr:hypothetical protein F383_19195 [Gossypium arboreum]
MWPNIHGHIYTYSRINSIIFISLIHKAKYIYHVRIHSSFTSYKTYNKYQVTYLPYFK